MIGEQLAAPAAPSADNRGWPRPDRRFVYPALFFVVLLIVWEGGVRALSVPTYILPAPTAVGARFSQMSSSLWRDAWVTILESLSGFALAAVVGVTLAVMIARFKSLELIVFPYLIALHTIPIIAIGPLLIMWFGFGLVPKILVAALIALLPIVINTVRGLQSVDYRVLELMDSLSATEWQVFSKIRLFSALPYTFAAFKVSVAGSVIGAVVGEFLGSDTGLGALIIQASTRLDTPLLFVAITMLGLIGVSLFLATTLLERRLLRWYEGATIL